MHLTLNFKWGNLLVTMPCVTSSGEKDLVIIGERTLQDTLNVDAMEQLKGTLFREGGDNTTDVMQDAHVRSRGG